MTRAPEQPALSGLSRQRPDVDPAEAQDWRESLDGVVEHAGPRRAGRLTPSVRQRARDRQVGVPGLRSIDRVSTIPPGAEPTFAQVQRRVRAYVRRNSSREEDDLVRLGGQGHAAPVGGRVEPGLHVAAAELLEQRGDQVQVHPAHQRGVLAGSSPAPPGRSGRVVHTRARRAPRQRPRVQQRRRGRWRSVRRAGAGRHRGDARRRRPRAAPPGERGSRRGRRRRRRGPGSARPGRSAVGAA
jgi:hypothetical protein